MVAQLRFFGSEASTTAVVRGKQMADFMGCSFNEPGDCDDVYMCFKCLPQSMDGLKHVYIDVGDDPIFVDQVINTMAMNRSSFTLIASQERMARMLRRRTKRKVIVIPEFHCNFENLRSVRPNKSKAIWVGNSLGIDFNILWLKERFRYDLGMNLKVLFFDKGQDLTRESLCKELSDAAIAIDFRMDKHPLFRNPDMGTYLKIINYASFGLPSVCFPREVYIEQGLGSCLLPVFSIDSMIEGCKLLLDNDSLWRALSDKGYALAGDFHISKSAEYYKALLEETK